MNEALITSVSATPMAATLMPAMSVKQAIERYEALVGFVSQLMKPSIDFGTIPGTDKPTLLKPGAEKLTTFFGLTKRFTIVEKVEDWMGADHGGEMFFYYLYRCSLYNGDTLIAEGDGSANSWEGKHRWRWVREDDVPSHLNKSLLKTRRSSAVEMVFAVQKAETSGKYGKPQEYWDKFNAAIEDGTAKSITRTTRNGQEYPAWEIESVQYRIPNDDSASLANTLQKMGQKRALIAATLLAVNASEFFTQDLEDLVADENVIEAEYDVVPEKKANGEPAKKNGSKNHKTESAAVKTSPEEASLNNLLRAHYEKERGKNGGPYFDGVVAKKSFAERQNLALDLGLIQPVASSNLGEHAADAAAEETVSAFQQRTESPKALAWDLWNTLLSKFADRAFLADLLAETCDGAASIDDLTDEQASALTPVLSLELDKLQ